MKTGETSTTKECLFKLSKPQINALNLQANSPSEEKEKHHSYKLSNYEVLAAHVWRTACKARDLANDQLVKLYIPTGGRSRLKDPTPLPQGYVGNVIFYTACIAKTCDITCKPLWYAAGKVHEALKNVENVEYLRSAVDYLESQPDLTPIVRGAHTVTCPNLTINSFGRLPFYEADFGWGKPEFAGHSKLRYEGQTIIVPSPIRDGSYSVNINLFAVHMPLFRKYFYDVGNLPNKL
ncbi:shikimate O-hydroxycinnamoyltransferase-like [Spinacia oleracea]|uniref:Shikimate O-hydroxycinnamoyltransferase-like n=1 Tax=Spinacia oleracea TaxID=3562 RepID=A0ABM3QZR2_SPIOL|nr:shikimate O-hydroxycinnamoyltransferase-like [Spinacia oleracea]